MKVRSGGKAAVADLRQLLAADDPLALPHDGGVLPDMPVNGLRPAFVL